MNEKPKRNGKAYNLLKYLFKMFDSFSCIEVVFGLAVLSFTVAEIGF